MPKPNRTVAKKVHHESPTTFKVMGVQRPICYAGHHVLGACSHPGSKPDVRQAKERRRKQNKIARASRRANR